MTITDHLDHLSAFEPVPYPVVSLYLDTRPDEHGRDNYQVFARKEMKARIQSYPLRSSERQSLERDMDRISGYLENKLQPSANGVAVFACEAAGLFETAQFEAPLERHGLYIGDQPHLYPLARVAAQYPAYAVVLADTARTRILVVAEGRVTGTTDIQGVKTRWTEQGALSQSRYQRHIENFHLHHVKDVVKALEKIVLLDRLDRIVLSGDVVVLPLLHEQMPKWIAEKVVDELSLPPDSPEKKVIAATLESIRKQDERTDREKVEAAVGAYRAGGLGVVGPDAVLLALELGQVDELLITASLAKIQPRRFAEEFVRKAHQTSARVAFIEDTALLELYGGVAATLRYRI
jgi:peptide subunit release factor 1 (eRF1)